MPRANRVVILFECSPVASKLISDTAPSVVIPSDTTEGSALLILVSLVAAPTGVVSSWMSKTTL
nr:hypothetical protein [uncultured Criibacterium sp.]